MAIGRNRAVDLCWRYRAALRAHNPIEHYRTCARLNKVQRVARGHIQTCPIDNGARAVLAGLGDRSASGRWCRDRGVDTAGAYNSVSGVRGGHGQAAGGTKEHQAKVLGQNHQNITKTLRLNRAEIFSSATSLRRA